ncbi:16S rRNA (cytidine(1402)-2'-O)-methyltransferase [Ammoniphilus oxalaticus]|uniref:Ribosomal RNA small subunit methyltransferase I n=1 Tax=Ammoniphilus oxalaticus TaxID=66863 RepID=A0A419SGE1_9BACL|nr:16S rRNA (cytidine(1402)-2'-O)-methyltransferase [Ammoniphilus oxalaticus]RKD22815.1 16S rRNA (cytidine(1402)-2'-O)-methyltransferase [Ammoniphilus oxalaticus]
MFIQSSFSASVDSGGQLYLVSTPIGNLGDITIRALETLRSVDIIAAEDTRQTKKLLNHFEIGARLVSHHEHNKQASGQGIIQSLQEGKKVALVSDAGMPAISDPGYELVRDATALEIPVIPIPGANAGLSALIASGLPTKQFIFVGFFPRGKKQLRDELERIKFYQETIIFYESPHRIKRTLSEVQEVLGNRSICIARELTKKYEEFIRGSIKEAIKYLSELKQIKGEFTIILDGNASDKPLITDDWWEELDPVAHVNHYIEAGESSKEAIKRVAEDRQAPKREIYQLYHRRF